MKILFVSHYFPPEELSMAFLVKELADYMAARGHEVTVLTSYPNWPVGKCFAGFNSKVFTTEKLGELTVCRIPFFASPNGSFLRRALDFKSFEFNIKRYGKRLPKPDLIYVHVPPNEDAYAADWLSRHFSVPFVLNVQDIHPDSAIELGYVKNPLLIRLLRRQERAMYDHTAHVTVIGENFRNRILKKGISPGKVTVIPNWIDARMIQPMDRFNPLRYEWSISADKFVVLYAGTFGRVHNTSMLIDAATVLDKMHSNIIFLLVGQGFDFNVNVALVKQLGLTNVIMKEFVPRARLSELQSLADVSVVTLRSGFGTTSVPSKVLGYMSAGRGVIGLIDDDCDTAKLIREADAGVIIPGGSIEGFVEQLIIMSSNVDMVRMWGNNARRYVLDHLDSEVVLERASALLESLVSV